MRIVVVSNRLPVTVTEENGTPAVKPSSGGLVTGLGSYLESLKNTDWLWIGWPGGSGYSDPEALRRLLESRHSLPVLLDQATADLFYNGFCNKTIWPLFHYFPNKTVYDEKLWENYRAVNEVFADEVVRVLRPDDVLWVHDYHLMLVPHLVRVRRPEQAIGFFLHIPFPSYELFRLLPRAWCQELLCGLLDADLVGFHTFDYREYFLRCTLRLLGYSHNMGLVKLEHRVCEAAAFPMGIDFERFNRAVDKPAVWRELRLLRRQLKGLKVIFAVDRQDYTKGILKRLEGYDLFLRNNPAWREKVVLVMVVVPSRVDVDHYQLEEEGINGIVGKINGDFGTIHWSPVIFQYKSITFAELTALYSLSDVGLVTPLRDGMNLVAKEYVACQRDKRGVLVLSETAGAAMELGEAVIINPNHREATAEAIKVALEMPLEEQARRMTAMQERLRKNDVAAWAQGFLAELERAREEAKVYGTVPLAGGELAGLLDRFRAPGKKIVFLDYDGTLTPFASTPERAVPGRRLMRIIEALCAAPDTRVVLISGRGRENLEKWYDRIGLTLVAEHGVWIREPEGEWRLLRPLNNDWKPKIIPIVETYRDRLADSAVEEKEYSVVWHFRNADPALSGLRVKEFVDDMVQFTAQNEIEVLLGNQVVEVKCAGVSKGAAAVRLLEAGPFDLVLAAGDDETDESLFRVLPPGSYGVKIGGLKSFAKYSLASSAELLDLLELMSGARPGFLRGLLRLFRRKGEGGKAPKEMEN
jgi:trehalose 6-phosphate synthase/phosphatase